MPKDYHESFAEEVRRRNGEKNPKPAEEIRRKNGEKNPKLAEEIRRINREMNLTPNNGGIFWGVTLSLITGLMTFYIYIKTTQPEPRTISQDHTNSPPSTNTDKDRIDREIRELGEKIAARKPPIFLPSDKILTDEQNIPSKPPLPLPPSGVIKKHNSSSQDNLGRIRIFLRSPKPEDKSSLTNDCSSEKLGNNNHAFVKFLDYNSNKVIMTAFIRSGDMINIPVPSGTYKIRAARGDQWYGPKDMFGSKIMNEMTEKDSDTATKFEFQEFSGYELGFSCSSGNLQSKQITDTDESLEK